MTNTNKKTKLHCEEGNKKVLKAHTKTLKKKVSPYFF